MRSNPITRHELVFSRNCQWGEGAKAIGPCNLYDSEFGENVVIGPFTEVGGAKIGARTKISSHGYLCPGVEIGRDCFVGHMVCFTNDDYSTPRTYDHIDEMGKGWRCKPTKVGNCVRIGSGAVILCGIEIGDHAVVGAGAVVTKNVPVGTIVMGVPARQHSHPDHPEILDPEGRFLYGLGETKI